MVLSANEESLIKVVRMLPPDEARKVLGWAQHLADLGGDRRVEWSDSAPTDCELRDWRQAGLHQPSFFRLFPVTLLQREVRLIGRPSESDWSSVRECFKAGFGSD